MSDWNEEQDWERLWHGNCINSYNEEQKQFVYSKKLGLKLSPNDKTLYNFDLNNKSILDIGGGPYSLLLKCTNFSKATVADPCEYPSWVYERYKAGNIESLLVSGEELDINYIYDEAWIYNVLQHVINPQQIIKNALKHCKVLRIFEWIENGITKGHPNNLHEYELNTWLKGYGKVEQLNETGCVGLSYYGIFKGDNYGR